MKKLWTECRTRSQEKNKYSSFESVTEFKYMRVTLKDQNCMHEELKIKLISEKPCLIIRPSILISYSRINSTESPDWSTGNVSDGRLMSQLGRERVDQCVSAIRVVELPVLFCFRSNWNHVTEVGGPSGLWDPRWRTHEKWPGLCGCNPAISSEVHGNGEQQAWTMGQ